jgi:poly(A) polymerase
MEFAVKVPTIDEEILESFQIYLVGGSLRDLMLGRRVSDYDLVVEGNLNQFFRFYKKKYPDSTLFSLSEEDQEYRVVIKEDLWLDITSIKGEDIYEDLKRRDFTINAMALDLRSGNIIDPTGGRGDVEQKVIRIISPINLVEDPLRILRAYRFNAVLGFEIESNTRFYLKELSPLLSFKLIAGERIRYELFVILSTRDSARNINLMADDGVLFSVFPELSPMKHTSQRYYNEQNLLYHTINALTNFERLLAEKGTEYEQELIWIYKLAVLLHDVGKPQTISFDEEGNTHFYGHDRIGAEIVESIAERLRLSKKERNILKKLVKHHMYPHLLAAQQVLTERAVNRYLRRMEELAFPLLDMAVADALASPPRGEGILPYHEFRQKIYKVLEEKAKVTQGRLITGDDLIALGLKPGPIFRKILAEIDDLVAEGKVRSKEDALDYVRENYLQ